MGMIEFDSYDDMQEFLRKRNDEANAGLAPEQQALTFGDCWVQFVDIAERHVIFGRIHTLEEVAEKETHDVVEHTKRMLDDGLMFGRAADRYNAEGELGYTHKASVWPIPEALYNTAMELGCDIDALPTSGKVLLQAAYESMRNHTINKIAGQQ